MARIIFIFALIVFLTACTPTATIALLPTVTSSPVPSITPTITDTEIPSIANPISPENMEIFTKAGFTFHDGTLFLYGINRILKIDGNNWVDETGETFPFEALKILNTNGVDFEGNDVIILTREIDGVKKFLLRSTETWAEPIDVAASQRIIDANPDTELRQDFWGDFRYIKHENIPEISREDIDNGRLFLSEQLALKAWPNNVRTPLLQYAKWNSGGNWDLIEFPNIGGDSQVYLFGVTIDRPILWENDGVRNLDAFRVVGEKTIILGRQYLYEGKTVVLHVPFTDQQADPTDPSGEFSNTQMALSNPTFRIVQPRVSNDSNITSLLPVELRNRMAELDALPSMLSSEAGQYLVGDEIYAMQQFIFEDKSLLSLAMQWYVRHESDPAFDELYPVPYLAP